VRGELLAALAGVEHHINGDASRTQPHVLNVSFIGVESEALMMALREELAISNGSACTSEHYSPSHVLKAMGLPDSLIGTAVRISWGPGVGVIPVRDLVSLLATLRA
jgi:cysteine desulfurase